MAKSDNRPVLKIVGENIRNLRLSLGCSQKDIGKAFGISQAAISYFEAGERDPGIDFLFAMAKKYGVPVTALIPIGRSGTDDAATALASNLVEKNPAWIGAFYRASRLTDHETDLVINMIECLAKGEVPNEP